MNLNPMSRQFLYLQIVNIITVKYSICYRKRKLEFQKGKPFDFILERSEYKSKWLEQGLEGRLKARFSC